MKEGGKRRERKGVKEKRGEGKRKRRGKRGGVFTSSSPILISIFLTTSISPLVYAYPTIAVVATAPAII